MNIQFLDPSDIKARLRLFRYGLAVITVVTFVISLMAPWAYFRNIDFIPPEDKPTLLDGLPFALTATVIVAIAMVIIYFIYGEILKRTVNTGDKDQDV